MVRVELSFIDSAPALHLYFLTRIVQKTPKNSVTIPFKFSVSNSVLIRIRIRLFFSVSDLDPGLFTDPDFKVILRVP